MDIDQPQEIRDLNALRISYEQGCHKSLLFILSKISHSLIKLSKKEEDNKNELLENLMHSNLLSGGFENRFINEFSEETTKAIKNFAIMENDNTLLNYVSTEEANEQDLLLRPIIDIEKDKMAEELMNLLQWELTRRHFWAKSGGEQAMTLTRCAFAVMVKFNQISDIYEVCINQLEFSLSEIQADNDNMKYKQLLKELQDV